MDILGPRNDSVDFGGDLRMPFSLSDVYHILAISMKLTDIETQFQIIRVCTGSIIQFNLKE